MSDKNPRVQKLDRPWKDGDPRVQLGSTKAWGGKIPQYKSYKKLVKVNPSALLVKRDGDCMRDGTYRGVATKPGETTRRTLLREDSESELSVRTEIDGESKTTQVERRKINAKNAIKFLS